MTLQLNDISDLSGLDFDTLIDVRSPAEFAEDRLPGAINLPVLNNAERARVGTIYKQVNAFHGRKVGAALVFANAAAHVAGPLAHHDGSWRPLVYCWRGGQRSGAFAWMLREIGWRAEVIDGGYRSYRRLVTAALYDGPLPQRFVQLGGYTGTAKTALLPRLAAQGLQVLDLEGLAGHRGSLLGGLPGGQPSQKAFETALAQALGRFDTDRPVIVEAESSKIGDINLPPSLWEAMKVAPWIEVRAPLDVRAAYLAEAYADILAEGAALREKLAPLRYHRGHAQVDAWSALIVDGDRRALCRSLAETHYDPAYRKAQAAQAPRVMMSFETDALDGKALDALAERIAERLQTTEI